MRGRLSNEAIGRLMLAAALAVAVGCGGSGGEAGSTGGSDAGDGGSGVAADGGTTAGVECAYSYSAYNSSVKLNSSASWSCGASARTLSGNGVPDHATGTFPNSNNPPRCRSCPRPPRAT